MESREFFEIYDTMLDDAVTIVHNQMVLSNIHAELDRNRFNPYEQDRIYQDHYGRLPSEPIMHEVAGVAFTSRILHQAGVGLTDIAGADLLYEIQDNKFALIQYKRVNNNQQIICDKQQQEKLLKNCPDRCSNNKHRPIPTTWLPLKAFAYCGIWYRVINHFDSYAITACEAESLFQGRSTLGYENFQFGISEDAFNELFASCRIGALISKDITEKQHNIVSQLLEAKHAILSVIQRGRWKRNG